jgi:hypothetical protein
VRARDWLCARASIRLESTFRIVTKLHTLRSLIPQAPLCDLPCGAEAGRSLAATVHRPLAGQP